MHPITTPLLQARAVCLLPREHALAGCPALGADQLRAQRLAICALVAAGVGVGVVNPFEHLRRRVSINCGLMVMQARVP